MILLVTEFIHPIFIIAAAAFTNTADHTAVDIIERVLQMCVEMHDGLGILFADKEKFKVVDAMVKLQDRCARRDRPSVLKQIFLASAAAGNTSVWKWYVLFFFFDFDVYPLL